MEIWKTIKNYTDYEVSNLGNIKSLKHGKERILKPALNSVGYFSVVLCKDFKTKTFQIHQLVAIEFLNHKQCGYELVINHIDFNKKNNRVENLEIVTARENSNLKHKKSSSKYTGVCWWTKQNRWVSQIVINKKRVFLGYFANEIDAHNAYQNKLNDLTKNH